MKIVLCQVNKYMLKMSTSHSYSFLSYNLKRNQFYQKLFIRQNSHFFFVFFNYNNNNARGTLYQMFKS